MRGVKIAITFMTLAIFTCLGILIYGMTNPNALKKELDTSDAITLSMMQTQQKPVISDTTVINATNITLPKGHNITDMTAGNDKVYFLLKDHENKQSLLIWSENQGQKQITISN